MHGQREFKVTRGVGFFSECLCLTSVNITALPQSNLNLGFHTFFFYLPFGHSRLEVFERSGRGWGAHDEKEVQRGGGVARRCQLRLLLFLSDWCADIHRRRFQINSLANIPTASYIAIAAAVDTAALAAISTIVAVVDIVSTAFRSLPLLRLLRRWRLVLL